MFEQASQWIRRGVEALGALLDTNRRLQPQPVYVHARNRPQPRR